MPEEKKRFRFRVSAHLVRLIGQELVASDEAAILELVKNAYDAGARLVTVTIEPVSETKPGFIKIQDNGQGLSFRDFERLFMVAGYSERPDEAATATRVPTGEKGIGRFASARLGNQLVVLTRATQSEKVLKIEFDWTDFHNRKKKFDEILIPYEYLTSFELPKGKRGTILRITQLHSDWKRERILGLRSALAELLDPFRRPEDFEIFLDVPGSYKLSGPIRREPPSQADIELQFRVLADTLVSRKISANSAPGSGEREIVSSKANTRPLIGMTGRFLYFTKRPSKEKTKGIPAGVRMYRDGVRLEPFGSPASDWLGLSEKRAKRAGHAHIVPSRLFGFVEISRLKHADLADTTSRQALIENEAAQSLVTLLREQLGHLEEQIRTQVSVPRWEAGKRQKAIKLERARLHSLGMMSLGLAHEMRQPLQVIRTQADNIVARLEELSIQDPEINESQRAIDRNIERIDETIIFLGELARGDLESVTDFNLADHLRLECRLFQNQSKSRGIDLEVNAPDSQQARVSKAGFSMILLNLWQNALEALGTIDDQRGKKITISLSKNSFGHLVEVSDNGPGISEEIKKHLFKEFTTEKTGGMGIGLYNCNLIVEAHGGKIEFQSRREVGTTFRVTLPDG